MDTQNSIMQKVWEVELEIMDVIHQVCVENNLKYVLAYGTLIGAVRHQGFIPWDDDIDIMMPRQDYDKLIQIWQKKAPEGYILQTYETNPDYTNNFAKVRKDGTTFLQDEYETTKSYHRGIFVDIFPMDKVPNKSILRKIQYMACAVNLLYTRGFKSGREGIHGTIETLLLKCDSKKYLKRRLIAEKLMRYWNKKEGNLNLLSACTIEWCKIFYPADLFEQRLSMDFCGRHYYVTRRYDEVLRMEYGDYMKLPPVEERIWKHHPIIIDFERNYEDIQEEA